MYGFCRVCIRRGALTRGRSTRRPSRACKARRKPTEASAEGRARARRRIPGRRRLKLRFGGDQKIESCVFHKVTIVYYSPRGCGRRATRATRNREIVIEIMPTRRARLHRESTGLLVSVCLGHRCGCRCTMQMLFPLRRILLSLTCSPVGSLGRWWLAALHGGDQVAYYSVTSSRTMSGRGINTCAA